MKLHTSSQKKWSLFELKEKLGGGIFGTVHLAFVSNTSEYVALKIISKHSPRWNPINFRNEWKAGKTLKHPGISKIRSYFETEDEGVLIMDYLEGMDLIDFMLLQDNGICEERALRIFSQLVSILKHCHSHGIAHRDVKLDNIRINADDQITLFDFGLCVQKNADRCNEGVGSIEYVAPEVLQNREYSAFKADVWSSGVVLYALLFGNFPFTDEKRRRMIKGEPISVSFPKRKVSKAAKQLVSALLCYDPNKRPNFSDIVTHELLRSSAFNFV